MSYTSPLDRLSPIARRYLQDTRHTPVHPHSVRRRDITIQSRTMNITTAELTSLLCIAGVLIAALIWLLYVAVQYTISWIWSYRNKASREHHRNQNGDEVSSYDEVVYREQDVTITQKTSSIPDIREHDVAICRRTPSLLERMVYVFKRPSEGYMGTEREYREEDVTIIRTPSMWERMGSVFKGPSRRSIDAEREGERQQLIAKHAVGKRVGYFEGINSYSEAMREAEAYGDGMYENSGRTATLYKGDRREQLRVVTEIPDRKVAFLEENRSEKIREPRRLEYVLA